MKTILFAHIEGNLLDINTKKVGYKRYYEKEAILAFSSWRKNGGYLKDIPIYAICLTKNGISNETKEKLKELNVTYIEDYQSETDNFKNGFVLKPFVLSYFYKKIFNEKELNSIIHIDLDMYLVKDITNFYNNLSDGIHCLTYDNLQNLDERNLLKNGFNTCFMIYKNLSKEKGFYINNLWLKYIKNFEEKFKYFNRKLNLDFLKIEEFAFDFLFLNHEFIYPIKNCIFGETYTDKKYIKNDIYFLTYHVNSKYDKEIGSRLLKEFLNE